MNAMHSMTGMSAMNAMNARLPGRCRDTIPEAFGRRGRHGVRIPPVLVIARLVCILAAIGGHASALQPEEVPSPAAVKARLDAAGDAIERGRPSAAKRHLEQAVAALGDLLATPKPPAATRSLLERARGVRDDLELQGVDVSGIELPSAGPGGAGTPKPKPTSKPIAKAPGRARKPASTPPEPTVSFKETIGPLLVRHCGGCHVSGRRGDFQFTSHASLLASGMVQKGAGADSRIVEVIRTGDMPRGGGKVPPDDLAALVAWIDEGAECDTDPQAGLAPGAAPAAAAPRAAVTAVSLEPGDVSFAFQVAPVLVKHCGGCHDAMQPDGNLSMVSLESLLRGGANGAAVVPGEGAASLLVRKLKGMDIDGQRMPLGKPPLPDEVVSLVETWIDQGTKLDLLSGATPLETVAAAGRARSLAHDDLRAVRFDAAEGVWRRSIADEQPAVVDRGDVRLVGNLSLRRLEALADVAEKTWADVGAVMAPEGAPLLKGGVVLLLFEKAYDYSAFWENVLGDERPKGLEANAGLAGDVVYAAAVAPAADSAADVNDARAVFAEEFASAAFLARGAPSWFSTAAGRAVAMKVAPKSSAAKGAKGDVAARMQRLRTPAGVVEGTASSADTAAIGGAFLAAVSGGGARYRVVAARLDEGAPFEEAFASVFKGTPRALFDAWLGKEGKSKAGGTGR